MAQPVQNERALVHRASEPVTWRAKALIGACVAVALLIVLVFIVAVFGGVLGEEFSPDSFQRRTYYFYEIPLIGAQVSPVKQIDKTNALLKRLTSGGIVTVPSGANRWDPVTQVRAGQQPRTSLANILCEYFDERDDDADLFWLDWTNDHPKMARTFWPEIASVARQGMYHFTPDMFAAARHAHDAAQLRRRLNSLLADKFTQAAEIQRQRRLHQQAVRLYSQALLREGRHVEALQGRAQSHQALGKQERAQQDLAVIARIRQDAAGP